MGNVQLKKDITKIDVCTELKWYINTIHSLPSNSTSLTDTYILYLKNLFRESESQPINEVFIKLFIPSEDRAELSYEMEVYKITNQLINLNINPGYTYVYNNANNCTYDNIFDIFNNKLFFIPPPLGGSGVGTFSEITDLERKFNRNIWFIINEIETESGKDKYGKRPALHEEGKYIEEVLNPKSYKFNFIVMQSHADKIELRNFVKTYKDTPDFRENMFHIFFLISTALYAFSLSGCVHNDIHYGNIFIEELKEIEKSILCINGIYFMIQCKYKVYIYDFDRSYCKNLGDNVVLNYLCEFDFQCNEWYDNLDFVTLVCFFTDYKTLFHDELIDCIVSDTEINTSMKASPNKGLNDNKYFFKNNKEKIDFLNNKCYKMNDIIGNIYKKLPSIHIMNTDTFNLYVCDSKYFNDQGLIHTEDNINIIVDDYEKIKQNIKTNGIPLPKKIRLRSETIEEGSVKKKRSDGRSKRRRSPKNKRKKRKSP